MLCLLLGSHRMNLGRFLPSRRLCKSKNPLVSVSAWKDISDWLTCLVWRCLSAGFPAESNRYRCRVDTSKSNQMIWRIWAGKVCGTTSLYCSMATESIESDCMCPFHPNKWRMYQSVHELFRVVQWHDDLDKTTEMCRWTQIGSLRWRRTKNETIFCTSFRNSQRAHRVSCKSNKTVQKKQKQVIRIWRRTQS